MIKKIPLEVIVCFALILLGFFAYMTIGLAEGSASKFLLRQERSMGALDYKSLPQIYAVALILLCTTNIIMIVIKQRKSIQAGQDDNADSRAANAPPQKIVVLRTIGTAALLIAYTSVMPFVPFFASTATFLFLLFVLYGKTRLRILLPLTIGGTAFFWFVFIKIASLPIGTI